MKVLKDPGQVLQIMDAKLNELRKKFDEADEDDAAEISGQEVAIINIAGHTRYAIEDHGYFGVGDMECVYEYVDDAKEKDHEYHSNPRDTWFMKGLAKGAAWAMKEIEKRMEEPWRTKNGKRKLSTRRKPAQRRSPFFVRRCRRRVCRSSR